MNRSTVIALALIVLCVTAPSQEVRHYVFYGLDRERITEPAFVETPALEGAQLKYRWSDLEPRRDVYDFSAIRHDLALLTREGKRLFIQLQDVSWVEAHPNVPLYLREDPEFHGGVERGVSHPNDPQGKVTFSSWVPRRWDPAVQVRMIALVRALAAEFDGKIEGLNFDETAIDSGPADTPWEGYTPARYYAAICDLMLATRAAFNKSCVLVYANFMPGDAATEEGRIYLKGIYHLADSIGVGVGGPDLLPKRRFQQKNSLRLIAARRKGTLAGLAVQDGNLADIDPATGTPVTVKELAAYARDPLHLDYLFWGTEEPYWSRDVVPYLRSLPQSAPEKRTGP